MDNSSIRASPLLDGDVERAVPSLGKALRQHVPATKHFRALMLKNRVLKQREWSATCCPLCPVAACCELLLPLGVLALLWWAKSECSNGGQCELPILEGWGGRMPKTNHSTHCVEGLPIMDEGGFLSSRSHCNTWVDHLHEPLPFVDVLAFLHWSGKRLALAVEDAADAHKLEMLRQSISQDWYPDLQMHDIPCVHIEEDLLGSFAQRMKHHGKGNSSHLPCDHKAHNPGTLPSFAKMTYPKILSARELDQFLDLPDYGSSQSLFGAVVFSAIGGMGERGAGGRWAYSIRLNVSAKTAVYTKIPRTRPLDLGLREGEANTYLNRGFLSLQLLIDRYIIGQRAEIYENSSARLLQGNGMGFALDESTGVQHQLAEPLRYLPQTLHIVPLPVAGVVIDGFYELIALAFPLVFIVAFLYTQKKVLNELIAEKETKVRESLRMLGVRSAAIISSWFVTYGIIFGLLCAVFTAVASMYVFPKSSATLIFSFFWLWCMSFLAFAWFIHCFFNHSRTGGIVGMIIMFAQWIVYASQNQEGPPSEQIAVILMIMPNAAFCTGLAVLAKFEAARVGATWGNLSMSVENCCFAWVLGMMCLDILLFTCLGWYFDRILPKEFGVRLPFNFFCTRSYWHKSLSTHNTDPAAVAADAATNGPSAVCVGDNAETVPEAVRRRSAVSGCVVRIFGLSREFKTPGGTKVAVAGLDLAMYDGQILALLGHNGAGKSTTINMLTGMVEPTSGTAIIAGHSLKNNLREIRQLIGVCPQHDVLWLELTVREHLLIYAQLRGVDARDVPSRARELMQQVGLTEKEMTRAGSLSGGQKRKLSLCLALIGRPPVVFLDEPTSGMDPFSRRSTWNIIREAREGRVVVLTTHFMDEADILGDRIAIMAEGKLQCCGSPLFLKNLLGAGYRLTCAKQMSSGDARPPGTACIETLIKQHVTDAERLTHVGGAEVSMRLPSSATSRFYDLLTELDARKAELGLANYGLTMVTLEEVFLRMATGTAGQEQKADAPMPMDEPSVPPQNSLRPGVTARHLGALFMKRARYGHRDCKALLCTVLLPVALLAFGLGILNFFGDRHVPPILLSVADQYGINTPVPYNLSYVASDPLKDIGQCLKEDKVRPLSESLISGRDKGIIFGRNYTGGLPVVELCDDSKCQKEKTLCSKIWPIIMLAQSVAIEVGCQTDSQSCHAAIDHACQSGGAACVDACVKKTELPASTCSVECGNVCAQRKEFSRGCDALMFFNNVASACPLTCAEATNPETCKPGTVCSRPLSVPINDPSALLRFETQLFSESQGASRTDARYGAIMLSRNASVGTETFFLYNTSGPHAVPAYINLLSSSLHQLFSGPGASIEVTSHPMPRSRDEKLSQVVSAVVNLTSTFVIIIAFSWIPAAIVAYIVREREAHHNCKHQQLISGVSLVAYWSANLLWDTCLYVMPLGLSMFFLWFFSIDAFVKNGALWATFVTFAGYGVAISPFSYMLSFLFAKHTTAQVISLVINFLTGLLLMLTSYILNLIDATKDVNESLMWIYRFFPGFCLGHGLFEICTNSLISSTIGINVDLLDWDIAGKDVTTLFVSAPCYFLAAVMIDYLLHSPLAAAGKYFDPNRQAINITDDDDSDVAEEVKRVASGIDAAADVIRLRDLWKVYRTPEGFPKIAVRGLSFGLRLGECFGFLGINGAGKTSTLNMLTGAVLPSHGSASLKGHDVVNEQWKVRRLLGYCPQHDALLDRLTVREHLELFGRIKGIPRADLNGYCNRMMDDLSLDKHMNKLAMTLSGGNKRKLSLAISLMGSPPLVFLDEPTTGVDPAARRRMWNVIQAISTGRCESTVMLTTHNMEEAEVLCSKIGIMVGGRLRCFGSNQHLKARFGSGYQLEGRLKGPSPAEVDQAFKRWQLRQCLRLEDIAGQCARLGNPERSGLVREGCEEGYLIWECHAREGVIPGKVFAEWWLLEDRALQLRDSFERKFPGTVCLERHERTFRFRLPRFSSLADVFKTLEASKADLLLEEYGVCQTSLEQIFNDLAAKQLEETGPVQGVFANGRDVRIGESSHQHGTVEMISSGTSSGEP